MSFSFPRANIFFCFSFAVGVVRGPRCPMRSLYRSPHRSAQPTASWNQTATQAKTMRRNTRLIDTTRRTRRNSVRTPSDLAQNAVQRIRAKQHCILRCARRAYDATPAHGRFGSNTRRAAQSPRARALCIAPRSTCACVAQLCAALRHGVARPRPRACRAQRAATIIRALSR